jgi:hypothetical protein
MIRLFQARSVERLVAPRTLAAQTGFTGTVTWAWARGGREAPVAPYPWVIEGYEDLPEGPVFRPITRPDGAPARVAIGGRAWAELAVDECFTGAEVTALRRDLRRQYGLSLVVEEIPLPMGGRPYASGACMPWLAAVGSGETMYDLSGVPGYDLPFPVWGVYHTDLLRPAFLSQRHVAVQATEARDGR